MPSTGPFVQILVNGVDVTGDCMAAVVKKAVTDRIGRCDLKLLNDAGQYTNAFGTNDSVEVKYSRTGTPVTQYRGRVEHADMALENNFQVVKIFSLDLGGKILDVKNVIENYIGNNPATSLPWKVSEVVNDLRIKYLPGVTGTGIVATTQTTTYRTQGQSLLSVLKELANSIGFRFFIDNSNDQHFEPDTSNDLGLTYNTHDFMDYTFPEEGREIVNRIFVYGDAGVAVMLEDRASQVLYGIREFKMADSSVKSENQAREKAQAILDEKANPIVIPTFHLLIDERLVPAGIITLNLNDLSISDQFAIVETEFNYLTGDEQVRMTRFRYSSEQEWASFVRRLEALESAFQVATILVRFLRFYETYKENTTSIKVRYRAIQDTFILDSVTNGIVDPVASGTQPKLDDRRSAETVVTLL